MDNNYIEKGNIAIAYFIMDAKCFPIGCSNVNDLHYNSSWDWLIPVIEKIASKKYPFNLYFSHIQNTATVYELNNNYSIVRTHDTIKLPIQIAFETVVEFLDYYNNKINKND